MNLFFLSENNELIFFLYLLAFDILHHAKFLILF